MPTTLASVPAPTPLSATDADRQVRRAWHEHGAAVTGYAASLLGGDEYAAQDVAQEVMLRLWMHPRVLDEARSLRGWLFTVTRNLVVDRHRRRRARPAEVAEDHSEPVSPDAGDDVLGEMAVWDLLRDLSPAHRPAVFLVHARGWSVAQTARALGVPPGTVKSRCHYALRHLRDTVTDRAA